MKKFLIIIACILCLLSVYIFFRTKPPSPAAKIHYHAGFLVYVDGVLADFSNIDYMNVDYCSNPHKTETQAEIQIGKAHLHDNVGDVVHVHRPGAVWGDLFTNIRYTFPAGKPLMGYINGQSAPDILIRPIRPYDSVIFVVGDGTNVDLTKTVSKTHMMDIEKHSEGCSV